MILTTFTTEVLEDVPHSPKPLIEKHILRAAQDFCQRTRIWEVALEDVSIVADTTEYTLTVPAQTDSGTNTLTNILLGVAELKDENDLPYTDFDYTDGGITLRHTPQSSRTLSARGNLKPGFDATYLLDVLYNIHFDGIVAGAKYRLQRMKDKEWSDPAEAERSKTIYEREIVRCRINRNNQYGTKQLQRKPTGW